MTDQELVEQLMKLAEGAECAALCEEGIMEKLQPAMILFNALRDGQQADPINMRHVFAYLDAKKNKDNWDRDARTYRRAIERINALICLIGFTGEDAH